MYEQNIREDVLFCMFYAGVAVATMIASIYLLLRRGNAFAAHITTPVRLRRWTAVFFAGMAFSHVWYVPALFFTLEADVRRVYFVGGLLDSMTVFPLAIIVLLVMLQDRRRPLWPVGVMMAPIVAGMVLIATSDSDALWPALLIYLSLLGIGFTVYMLRALRQYGRWLRDNYADLEHKEVWQSFVVLAVVLLMFGLYVSDISDEAQKYVIQVVELVAVCYLLWRVETLSDLSLQQAAGLENSEVASLSRSEVASLSRSEVASLSGSEVMSPYNLTTSQPHSLTTSRPHNLTTSKSQIPANDIAQLLQERCVGEQLYLQHGLTLQQLAKAVGINRYYLSQYFSGQGTTYNAYINGLRIDHFVGLYREAVASHRSFTTKQMAHDSGYHSYSTFSLAFKQRMGQNVSAWMKDNTQ